MGFPRQRMRRLRESEPLRRMVRETVLAPSNLIYPLFVKEGTDQQEAILSMPGQFRWSIDRLLKEATDVHMLGVPAVMLFGIPDHKDERGSSGYDPNGIVQRAVRALKDHLPGLFVVTDVCIDEYTSHGHCGIVKDGRILNDETLDCLRLMAKTHAEAGADMVAPSDMMDGRVAAIRDELDQGGSSTFPSCPMPPSMPLACMRLSGRRLLPAPPSVIGARIKWIPPMLVKPSVKCRPTWRRVRTWSWSNRRCLTWIFIVRTRAEVDVPVAAFQVSGEYSMIKAAAQQGWLDESKVTLETLLSIKRAGADLILTYFAKDAAKLLNAAIP